MKIALKVSKIIWFHNTCIFLIALFRLNHSPYYIHSGHRTQKNPGMKPGSFLRGSFDRDFFVFSLGLFLHRDPQFEYAVTIMGFDLLCVKVTGQFKSPMERAEYTLMSEVVFCFSFLFFLLLSGDSQYILRQLNLDVLFLIPGRSAFITISLPSS